MAMMDDPTAKTTGEKDGSGEVENPSSLTSPVCEGCGRSWEDGPLPLTDPVQPEEEKPDLSTYWTGFLRGFND